jgi:hypothetical protein
MILLGITVAGAVVVFSVSIAGLIYSKKIVSKFYNLECSVYLFVNEVMEGSSAVYTGVDNWIGINEVIDKGDTCLA